MNVEGLHETAQTEFDESIENLESKFEGAEQRLAKLREAGGEAWTQAEDDLEKALGDLQSAYEDAAAAFEKARQSNQPEAGTAEQPGGKGNETPAENPPPQ